MEIVDVHGSALTPLMVDQLGTAPDVSRIYRIATSEYAARDLQERIGRIENWQRSSMVRDVVVAYLKKHGFAEVNQTTSPS